MVSSVQGGRIVWCLLSRMAKNVVSFVHPGKISLVSFVLHLISVGSGKTERNNRLDIARQLQAECQEQNVDLYQSRLQQI